MPTAEIITIGTEILLGEIIDTNSRYIARALRKIGVDIYRTTSIGDNAGRIAEAIQEALPRAEIVITTGGLGPTVDDPTRDAIAEAFGVKTEYHEALWDQVVDRFARFHRYPTENNRRQAYLPSGAIAIENPVGTAPAFLMETETSVVISLPGVPKEMEHLLEHAVIPYISERFVLEDLLKVRILHTAGVGESQIDERIGDLETLTNPTVGLAAHSGQVDVRITAKATSEREANHLIREIETEVRVRLGNWIYGSDDETLVEVAMRSLRAHDWDLVAVEAGLEGKLVRQFAPLPVGFRQGEVWPNPLPSLDSLHQLTLEARNNHQADVGLGVALYPSPQPTEIHIALITPLEENLRKVPYGGPPGLATRRAVNLGLDMLRKIKGADEKGAL